MELVQTYYEKNNKLAVNTNFLAFFLKNFPSWIRIRIRILNTGGKMNADPDLDPQPWFY